LTPRRELAANAAACTGLIVAAAQLIVTAKGVVDPYRSVALVACGIDASRTLITVVSILATVLALSAMVALFLERYSGVLALVGAEAAFFLVWIALGGTKVATCVL
jgi:hypothetical protein